MDSNNAQRQRSRKQARAEYTSSLTSPFDTCGYCRKGIMWHELMCPTKLIEKGHRFIKWMNDGVVCSTPAATIEHVIPLSEGGSNLPENTQASCWECNNERSNPSKPRPTGGKLIQMRNRGKYRRH